MNRRRKKTAELLLKRLGHLLGIHLDLPASEKGKRLESYCARKCRALGFHVVECGSKGKPYDLIVNGHRVQCKNRTKHGHNQHGVNLFKNSRKRYLVTQVDFFIIRFHGKCYVIPASDICDGDGLVLGWIRLTNKNHYVNAWSQLCGEPVMCDRQGLLFTKGNHGR